jgi:hypothetical protein
LFIAASEGHCDAVKCLVKELGADVHSGNDFPRLPVRRCRKGPLGCGSMLG